MNGTFVIFLVYLPLEFVIITIFVLGSLTLPSVREVSPLNFELFEAELTHYPDRVKANFVLQGIKEGFRLGCDKPVILKSARRNKLSAYQHSSVIDTYLANEVRLGRVAGPFDTPPVQDLHISSFGVIPKKGQPDKWRLIVDLSSPLGHSVNDGIDPESWHLQYIKMDDIIKMVSKFGPGALMAKFDIESAYRNIAINPSDRHLLGLKWRDAYYIDLALPFGLRSAPAIFNSVAELVEWILVYNYGIEDLLHYLDDFILDAPANSVVCASNLQVAVAVVARLGLPLHPQKCLGPASCMVILGIELDTAAQIARLPADKFSALQVALSHWSSRKCCTKKDLQSLIGRLHHACMVVWPGRTFLRRMIDLLSCFRNDSHPIRLNVEFRKDLAWWVEFFGQWNGISFFLFPNLEPLPDFSVSSDASGAIGYGAFMDNEWFNGRWSTVQLPLSIAYKELFPVVLAAHVCGPGWSRRRIMFHVDNEAVVHILNSRTSPDPNIMHLLRNLLKAAACFSFTFAAIHVPGRNNGIADALSRFNFQAFHTQAPQAKKSSILIPVQLLAQLSIVV